MKNRHETKELENYLEKNAAQLVPVKMDKKKLMLVAQSDIRKRKARAERLQKLRREKLHITQKKLADAVGANLRTLQSWETGRQEYPKPVEILMLLMEDMPSVKKRLVRKG
jgi:DNA-binding transcriptional regulator YiaG